VASVRLVGRPTGRVELLVVGCYPGDDGPRLAPGDDAPGVVDASTLTETLRVVGGFTGETGQCVMLPAPLAAGARGRSVVPVVVVGLGARDECNADRLRDAAHLAVGRAVEHGHRTITTSLAQAIDDAAAGVRAVVEGLLLGGYRPGRDDVSLTGVTLVVAPGAARTAAVRRALEVGAGAARATNWVRRLVTTPAGDMTPADLADEIRTRARAAGVACRVWSGRSLADKGFGAVIGVGAGSHNRPCVVELRAGSGPSDRTWGLAGKGITFDSGGLNLKRDPREIAWMKSDMAGAGAVAAAVTAAQELGAGEPVRALLPLAENLPGGGALRPGDVVRHPGGRTTEVTDTDCEGRLVLADALAYLASARPAALLDVGTLTDGGGVGDALWGCWASDRALAAALLAAGSAAGEPGWELPLRREYARLLSSDVADSANCPADVPDSGQLAATYLRPFTAGVPWVHVDNGSTAYLELARPPWPKGATGSPTRALLELLLHRA
jgi:leucyl aminopeptidase